MVDERLINLQRVAHSFPTSMSTRINTKQLIAHFGGRIELWRRLEARGFKLSVKTIEKWMERDNIPATRLVQLMELANTEGRPLDLNKFVSRSAPNATNETFINRHENKNQESNQRPNTR